MCTTPISLTELRRRPGSSPFGRLVDEVMNTEPYKPGAGVFSVVDNGSSHCGRASVQRMADADPTARLIHLPVHASWLNQIVRLAAQRSRLPDSSTGQPTSRAGHRRLRAEPRRDWARR